MMTKATAEEAVAVTAVFWDIKSFPVPPGFDARRVGPCIKRFLEKYGYFGPLTINAVGLLTDVHDDILGALSSSGINTYYGPFGVSSDIFWLFYKWTRTYVTYPRPTNILGICNRMGFPRDRPRSKFNIFGPLSYSSPHSEHQEDAISWINLILAESEAVGEDTCSETGEYFCSICYNYDHPGQDFESFKRHLSSLEHTPKKLALVHPRKDIFEEGPTPTIVRFQPEATPEEAVAATVVFWDVKRFPVPPGFDPRRVGPCIKRFLEKYGYINGPLTINALGKLTVDVPLGILGDLSSTGINTYHAIHGSSDIMLLISRWISKNPPPANILGICDPRGFSLPPSTGYNIFRPFSYSSPQQDAFLWETFLLADSEPLEEDDTCCESPTNFGVICLGFETFASLLSSRKHTCDK